MMSSRTPRARNWLQSTLFVSFLALLTACGGGGGGSDDPRPTSPGPTDPQTYDLSYTAGENGSIEGIAEQAVDEGANGAAVTAVPAEGYHFVEWSDGNTDNPRTDADVDEDLAVTAEFALNQYTLTYTAGENGSFKDDANANQTVAHGSDGAAVEAVPGEGYFFTGWSDGNTANPRTDSAVSGDVTVTANFAALPVLSLTPQPIKTFHFEWDAVEGATEYRLLENADGVSGFTELASLEADATEHDLEVFLPGRVNASYILEACTSTQCYRSAEVPVEGHLAEAVGYVKASQVEKSFGESVAISGDGKVLAVGAVVARYYFTGYGTPGRVYLYERVDGSWLPKQVLEAPNAESDDAFGVSVALSEDGSVIAVGAPGEDSLLPGGLDDNSGDEVGVVYMFERQDSIWQFENYIKPSDGKSDWAFGKVSISSDGSLLAVGALKAPTYGSTFDGKVYLFQHLNDGWTEVADFARAEARAFGMSLALASDSDVLVAAGFDTTDDSSSGMVYVFEPTESGWEETAQLTIPAAPCDDICSVSVSNDGSVIALGARTDDKSSINADADADGEGTGSAPDSGSVHIIAYDGSSLTTTAYIKASNVVPGARFGYDVSLSGNGNRLAVLATGELTNRRGINGASEGDFPEASGATYLFENRQGIWTQTALIKASNAGSGDGLLDGSIALAKDGSILAVGLSGEDGAGLGLNGDQSDNSAKDSGAVYLY